MKNLTLKWSIILFYFIFGLLPLGLISCLTLVSYSRSITRLTEQHVTELINQTGDRIENQCYNLFKYMDILSKFPYVQLSFLQWPHGGQGSTVNEKLDIFRLNCQAFSRLTLYSNEGEIVAVTPDSETGAGPADLNREMVRRISYHNYFHMVDRKSGAGSVLLFKTVFDYGNPERTVGLVCGRAPLTDFIDFVKNLDLGDGVEKTVLDGAGQVLFEQSAKDGNTGGSLREYITELPILNWRIAARIPEKVLYSDVDLVRRKTLVIAGLAAVVAVFAVLVFSSRITRPLQDIIKGAGEFASGNLDYRIKMPWGVETRRVAEAFNAMTKQLGDRQAELAQAGKMASLGLLSAGFVHEVGNPLAGIKTTAQVLERRGTDARERSLARGISKEVDRLNQIIEGLLHFSRPKQSLRAPCDLLDITRRSLALMDARLRKKRVTVNTLVQSSTVTADQDQMIQVLLNLLLNALHVVEPDRGIIVIDSGLTPEGKTFLSVADNGPGISPEMVTRIFDPFFSLSKEGTGLGLSIVQTLVRQNKVRLDVSGEEGSGARFTLIFPELAGEDRENRHG